MDTPEYLNAVGSSIHKLMKTFDPDAMWVMQAWSFRKDIASVVPKHDLLVLSLNGALGGEDHFCNHDFVVGNLHNFGGRVNLHGDLPLVSSNQFMKAKQETPNVVAPVCSWSRSDRIRCFMSWPLRCRFIRTR